MTIRLGCCSLYLWHPCTPHQHRTTPIPTLTVLKGIEDAKLRGKSELELTEKYKELEKNLFEVRGCCGRGPASGIAWKTCHGRGLLRGRHRRDLERTCDTSTILANHDQGPLEVPIGNIHMSCHSSQVGPQVALYFTPLRPSRLLLIHLP